MIEALLLCFLGGLFVGWLSAPQPLVKRYETGFLNGIKATLNAEKKKMKDGRSVLFIEGLFEEESEG